jgi:hypothetical protein
LAILVLAQFRVIDAIAVADIEPIPGAVLPDRVLDEPGKSLRKGWIELPGIDPLGHERRAAKIEFFSRPGAKFVWPPPPALTEELNQDGCELPEASTSTTGCC